MDRFPRITVESDKLGGQACIRGLRIPVHVVLDLLAAGRSPEAICADHPDLTLDDVREAIDYAAWLAREESFPISPSR